MKQPNFAFKMRFQAVFVPKTGKYMLKIRQNGEKGGRRGKIKKMTKNGKNYIKFM